MTNTTKARKSAKVIELPCMDEVVMFAAKCHAGQTRKGNCLPYIVHPIGVLSLIAQWGVKCQVARKAAVCHDVREECPDVTYDQLVAVVGKEAADVCEELTFFPDAKSSLTEQDQKHQYMKTFMNKSIIALVVKMADRVCNTLDFFHGDDPKYAAKYWSKGKPLFEAFKTRCEERAGKEVQDTFGEEVYTQMKWSHDSVQRLVVR